MNDFYFMATGAYAVTNEKGSTMHDQINPDYYQSENIELIDVIESFYLDFHSAQVLKYIVRAGKKTNDRITDLRKAKWYLDRLIINEIRETDKQKQEEIKL